MGSSADKSRNKRTVQILSQNKYGRGNCKNSVEEKGNAKAIVVNYRYATNHYVIYSFCRLLQLAVSESPRLTLVHFSRSPGTLA